MFAKVTQKGQVLIPAPIRKKLGITRGSKLKVEEHEGEVILKPLLKNPIKQARGILKGGKSALNELLQSRKEESRL